MINTSIKFIRNAVRKYKAQRVHAMVDAYANALDVNVALVVPEWIKGMRKVSHAIVDKTYANPEPALKLLDALNEVGRYYGPEIMAEIKTLDIRCEAAKNSPEVVGRIDAWLKSIEDMRRDVNDH